MGLAYGCVLGRMEPGEQSVHARRWVIAPTHVQAAVAASLSGG